MGRPETPLASTSTVVVQEFAAALRDLRVAAGSPSYRAMGERVHFSHTALSKAASGQRLPTLDVTLAYVRACGADNEIEWRARWANATKRLQTEPADQLEELVNVGARGRKKRRSTSTTTQKDVAEEDADADVVQAHDISGSITVPRFEIRSVALGPNMLRRVIGVLTLVIMLVGGGWLATKLAASLSELSTKPFEIQDVSGKPLDLRPGALGMRTVLLRNPNDFDLVVTAFTAMPGTPHDKDDKPVESCRSLLAVATPAGGIAVPANGTTEVKIGVEVAATVPPECADVVFPFIYSGSGIKGEIVNGITTSQ